MDRGQDQSAPLIAVASASRRSVRLAFLLEALAEQTLPLDRFEVVIARDVAAGPEPPVPPGLNVTFLRAEGPTPPSVRRNMAWRAARAPIVAFTDDDCRPAPDWLESILAAAGEEVVLQGRTAPDPAEGHLLHGLGRSQDIDEISQWFETCNMAYPRALLERIGGLDERYGFGAEDTDLALRASEAGAEIRFEPTALVWHGVNTPTLRGAMRGAWEWEGMPLFVKNHPEQRSMMFGRVFWKRSHALLLLGVAVSVAAALTGIWWLLAGWLAYAYHHLGYRHLRRPARFLRSVVYLPQIALVELVEIAACVRESIRARTVLL